MGVATIKPINGLPIELCIFTKLKLMIILYTINNSQLKI